MSRTLRFTISVGVFALIVISSLAPVQGQTQASCQFTSFNRRLFISSSSGHRVLVPRGVNDYNTVVGEAQDDGNFSVRGFTRSSSGSCLPRTSRDQAAGWRRGWDSNPRGFRPPVFKTGAINHSATSPRVRISAAYRAEA